MKINMDKREAIVDMGYEDSICLDGYDDAIIGVSDDGSVVYAVQVVRCKECKWWDPARCTGEPKTGICKDKCASERPDDYCSHGERRTNEVDK